MGWIAANARKFPSSPAPVAGADVEVEVCAVEDRAIEKPNKTREREFVPHLSLKILHSAEDREGLTEKDRELCVVVPLIPVMRPC